MQVAACKESWRSRAGGGAWNPRETMPRLNSFLEILPSLLVSHCGEEYTLNRGAADDKASGGTAHFSEEVHHSRHILGEEHDELHRGIGGRRGINHRWLFEVVHGSTTASPEFLFNGGFNRRETTICVGVSICLFFVVNID